MHAIRRLPASLLVLSLALALVAPLVAACGSTPSPAAPTATAAASTGATSSASSGASRTPSISTPWGPILAGVPKTFPVFPSAAAIPVAQVANGPVSAAWTSPTGVTEVAAWYRDELGVYGFIDVELRPAAADGARVIDAIAGSAGCEAQVTVRPSGGSAIITVLWGVGCAKLGG
jgi:hypothetical protein